MTIPLAELDVRFSRSSGPGGQNVNKRDTRVEVVFDLDGSSAISDALKARARSRLGARLREGRLRVVSGAARTQAENRRRAVERLGELLADALRPPPKPRRPTTPTKTAREKRLSAKRIRADVKKKRRRPLVEVE